MITLARSVLLATTLLSSAAPAAAGQPTTFDDVVSLVKGGEQPGVILDKCGTVFTLSLAQRQRLTQAGASAALIAALEKPRTNLSDVRNYALVVDCSGSMSEPIEGTTTKMDAAKVALRGLLAQLPSRVKVSLTVYGHDAALKCQAVKVLRPLEAADADGKKELDSLLAGLKPAGHTPIALALAEAGKTLAAADGLCQVVLVTDGLETCHGDPGKAAEELALRPNVRDVSVIGFGLKAEEKSGVAEIARRGRGKFLDAQSAKALAAAVREVVEEEPKTDDLSPRVKALVEQLGDESFDARKAAAEGLGKMGEKAKGAGPFLVRRVADDKYGSEYGGRVINMGDKDAALASLKIIAAGEVEKALVAATKSKAAEVKAWAARALAALDPVPAVKQDVVVEKVDGEMSPRVKALAEQLADDSFDARKSAAEALGKMGDKAKGAADALAKRVADDKYGSEFGGRVIDLGDKDAALAALKSVAPDRVEKAVIAATKSKAAEVKAWAAKALAALDDK